MNSSFIEKLNNKLNMIELTSKPIVENAMAWQQHGTPDNVINMMLDMYYENGEFKNNEKILILFNVEIIKQIYFKYRDELIFGNLYFVADSKEKFDIVKMLYPNIHCVLCDQHTIEKLMEKIGEFNVKKFDVVFSNPPYNKNLDLKIIQSIFKFSKNIIFIHPASWCFCRDFTAYKHLKFVYDNKRYLNSIYLFWGNVMFNIGLFTSLCISYWTPNKPINKTKIIDKAYSKETYEEILGNFSYHGNFDEANNLKLTILNYLKNHEGSILDHNIKAGYLNMTNFSVRFAVLRGNAHAEDGLCEDFYSLICKNKNDNKCNSSFRYSKDVDIHLKNIMTLWSFNTENEQNNFINYCCSKIVRFLLTFTKTNANVIGGQVTNIIPWLDFTQEWNDAKLCKEFGISEELWQYIDNFIPDYYDDYKSGFEK